MASYFAYEKDFANRWNPVCYHQSKPNKSVNGSDPERSTFYEIPAELMSGDSPMFGKLMKMFPAPKEI